MRWPVPDRSGGRVPRHPNCVGRVPGDPEAQHGCWPWRERHRKPAATAPVEAMSAVANPSVCGDPDMAAEGSVFVAKVVLGLGSSFVRTEVGRRDDFVVDVDHGVVAFDGRDRDAAGLRGTAASLGDLEGQPDGMRFADGARRTSSASATVPGPLRVVNACAIARGLYPKSFRRSSKAGHSCWAAFPRSAAFAARRKSSNSPSPGFIEPSLWCSAQLNIGSREAWRPLSRRATRIGVAALGDTADSSGRCGRGRLEQRKPAARAPLCLDHGTSSRCARRPPMRG